MPADAPVLHAGVTHGGGAAVVVGDRGRGDLADEQGVGAEVETVRNDRASTEELLARAHQSGRRVGMFLAGDFAAAARWLLAESGYRVDEPPSLVTLRSLCEQVPALADLLRLAVSPEYASARWHVVAPNAPRGTISSGRFSLF